MICLLSHYHIHSFIKSRQRRCFLKRARNQQQLFNPKVGLSGLLPFKAGKLFILTLLFSFLILPRLRPCSILYWCFSFLPHVTTYFSQRKKTRPLSWERFFSSSITESLQFLWLVPSRRALRLTSFKTSFVLCKPPCNDIAIQPLQSFKHSSLVFSWIKATDVISKF